MEFQRKQWIQAGIVFNCLAIALVVFVLYTKTNKIIASETALIKKAAQNAFSKTDVPPDAKAPAIPPRYEGQTTAVQEPEDGAEADEVRNILFSFRDSRPKQVAIVADFTEWQPHPMARGDNHTWTAFFQLAPGEYQYNFILDGLRSIRDPNNPRTSGDGRSLISVKPKNP